MPRQMPEQKLRKTNFVLAFFHRRVDRKPETADLPVKGRLWLCRTLLKLIISLSELPPPAVALPASGHDHVAHAWRATIASYTSV